MYCPCNFQQENPETTIHNIRAVVEALEPYGLTGEKYLKAALRYPQLFYQCPETIISHYIAAQRIVDKGIIKIRAKTDDKLLIDYFVQTPALFGAAIDNYELREIFFGNERDLGFKTVIKKSRESIEEKIITRLEQTPVIKQGQKPVIPNIRENKTDLTVMSETELKNIAARAMIRCDIIKSCKLG